MPVFLFWNVAKKPLANLIASACRENSVDVLILAESELPPADLLQLLNSHGEHRYYSFNPFPSDVTFYLRLPTGSIHAVFDDGRVAIRRLVPPLGPELLIVACHLPSKLHSQPLDQGYRARQLRIQIANAERQVGHKNSLVIGDLNMNPFEEGMSAADGLHAVMDKQVARRPPRTFQNQSWDYFYNPMWSRLGDDSAGPSGTYYYPGSHLVSYYWNTFDQVLLRPELLPFYELRHLQVLSEINGIKLIGDGRPMAAYSDHLPIVIKLDTERGV